MYIGTIYRVNGQDLVYTGLTYPLYNFRDKGGNALSVTAEDLHLESDEAPVEDKGKGKGKKQVQDE